MLLIVIKTVKPKAKNTWFFTKHEQSEKERVLGLNDNVIILFTRIPAPGKTKTRLQTLLTGEECCFLHKAFLCDIYNVLLKSKSKCDITVFYEPDGDVRKLKELLPNAHKYLPQHGKSLGDKMHNAISSILSDGYNKCLLIGSDIPLLKESNISEAISLLDESDIVICPTEDGGYFLIGMKKPCEEAFLLDEYGVSTVFEKTKAAVIHSKKTLAVGAATLDIDEPCDLYSLANKLKSEDADTCPETRKALQELKIAGSL